MSKNTVIPTASLVEYSCEFDYDGEFKLVCKIANDKLVLFDDNMKNQIKNMDGVNYNNFCKIEKIFADIYAARKPAKDGDARKEVSKYPNMAIKDTSNDMARFPMVKKEGITSYLLNMDIMVANSSLTTSEIIKKIEEIGLAISEKAKSQLKSFK